MYDDLIAMFRAEVQRDYIGLWQIVGRVKLRHPQSPAAVIDSETLTVIAHMLSEGFVVGHPTTEGGFLPCADQNKNAVLDRIRSELRTLDGAPVPLDIVWFNLPPASASAGEAAP